MVKTKPKGRVHAGLLHLSKVTRGTVHVKRSWHGLVSMPKASNVKMHFAPGTTQTNYTPGRGGAFSFGYSPELALSGNGGSTNTISSAVTAGISSSFTVATSIAPGWYFLGHRNRSSTDSSSRLISGGELVYVTSTGTSVTIANPVTESYAAGVSIQRVTETLGIVGINNAIIGGRFASNNDNSSTKGSAWAMVAQGQVGLKMQRVFGWGGRVDCIRLFACQDFDLRNISTAKCQSNDATTIGVGYALAINMSNSGYVRGVSGLHQRHTAGNHRLSHNIYWEGIHGYACRFVFDVHDGGNNIQAHRVSTPYKTFSDSIARVAKDFGGVSIGNNTHVNLTNNVTMSNLQVGDIFINHAVSNLTISGSNNTARRVWLVPSSPGTVAETSQFRVCTMNVNVHGLANSSAVDTGETCVDDDTAKNTLRWGTTNGVATRIDRVRLIGEVQCYDPAPALTFQGAIQGTWTDYTARLEGTLRQKAGLGSATNPIRSIGFGAGVTGAQRFEFANLDIYQHSSNANVINSQVTSADITVAAQNCRVSLSGGALSALSTSTNVSSTITRDGVVTSL